MIRRQDMAARASVSPPSAYGDGHGLMYTILDFFQKFFTIFSGLWLGYDAMLLPQSHSYPRARPGHHMESIMVPPVDNPVQLSVHRAFVVQCWADTAVEQGPLAGQGEHRVSGQAPTF
jgi:hypothetical protein